MKDTIFIICTKDKVDRMVKREASAMRDVLEKQGYTVTKNEEQE